MTKDQGPWPGDIRAVNYIIWVTEDGETIHGHRLEQYGARGWKPIRVYDEGEDGELTEVPQ